MTVDQWIAVTGLDAGSTDRALQSLLVRRDVVCDSYQPPGRGGQSARDPDVLYHLHETEELERIGCRLSEFLAAPRRRNRPVSG